MLIPSEASRGWGGGEEREAAGRHGALFVAPSGINRSHRRSYRPVLGRAVPGPLRARGQRLQDGKKREQGAASSPLPPPLQPPSPRLYLQARPLRPPPSEPADRSLTKTFLLFLHELIYGRPESSSSAKRRNPAKVASVLPRLGATRGGGRGGASPGGPGAAGGCATRCPQASNPSGPLALL